MIETEAVPECNKLELLSSSRSGRVVSPVSKKKEEADIYIVTAEAPRPSGCAAVLALGALGIVVVVRDVGLRQVVCGDVTDAAHVPRHLRERAHHEDLFFYFFPPP